ncbi:hypothetical protein CR205_11655 [Alteribacter lacisalsi]|uniref:Uncharacterized protein n=1 Tax=Alteribacter lacisalsi TaxID=2045244 RepID=A0A2W0H3H2_9BACI|nr:hypothetical protein [Alteribacter lacisalsi]PYZ96374.1 hypothetical protein CR205_11655 [Alteribacter lacisalsi]
MFRFIRRGKRWRRFKKVREGDGHKLKPYRLWHVFTCSLFHFDFVDQNNVRTAYAVNSKYWLDDPTADLYRNGSHIASSKLPAAFPVEGGVIEVEEGTYGINRMHFVTDQKIYPFYPDKRSVRGLRLELHKRFPSMSSFIAISAAVILFISLILGLPQVIEVLSEIPWIVENIGTFVSPITLPVWVNTAMILSGILAGIERTLMLRSHWLIDMETGYWDD